VPWAFVAAGEVMLDASLPEPVPGRSVHGRIELRAGGSAAKRGGRGRAARRAGGRRRPVGSDLTGRLVADAARRGRRRAAARARRRRVHGLCRRRRRRRRRPPARARGLHQTICPRSRQARFWSAATRSCSPAQRLRRAPRSSARGRPGSPSTPRRRRLSRRSASIAPSTRRRRQRAAHQRRGGARADWPRGGARGARPRLPLPRRLRQAGAGRRCRGVEGAVSRAAPRQALEVADTLGAGDAFAGCFLLVLARGEPAAALRAGCDAAATAIGANCV
jgi:pfkB family carbohydrate kinase